MSAASDVDPLSDTSAPATMLSLAAPVMVATATKSGLPRLLMLHGWTQSAEVLRGKTHAWLRKVGKVADVVFMTAPHELPASFRKDGGTPYAWWYYDEADKTRLPDEGFGARTLFGWEESRRAIAQTWREHGPFDFVCGFSQGAVAAHLLLAELEARSNHGVTQAWQSEALYAPLLESPPKGAIFVCGFPSGYAEATAGLPADYLLQTPSLHLSASNDPTVPPHLQKALSERFHAPRFHSFDTGHAMPQRAGDVAPAVDFITACTRLDAAQKAADKSREPGS